MIRPFRRDDVPAVLELFRTAFLNAAQPGPSGLDTYFDRVFFDSPWYDDALPSYVHLDQRGGIDGFVGVQPRRLTFRGRPLRGAVATKLMVAPTAGSLAAVGLLRRVFAGPQDVLLSDLSNDAGRKIFEGLGGATVLLSSLEWRRSLRPARHSLSWLEARGVPAALTRGLRPLGAVADRVAARFGPHRLGSVNGHLVADLPLDLLAARLPEFAGRRSLHPAYDVPWLEWWLGVARRNEPNRALRCRLVTEPAGDALGWFIYLAPAPPGGMSEVLQLVARRGAADAVLTALLADAWDGGAVMLTGRLDPATLREMSDRRFAFRQSTHWMTVHAKDPAVLAAVMSGDALLSRLEGEW